MAGYYGGGYGYGFRPYVPVHMRRARAQKAMEKRKKAGHAVLPIEVSGRTIATTFWGQAWCQNLERYSDYANRLPRGRTYVRNGSVVHLDVAPGRVEAMVSGSELYTVSVHVAALPAARWKDLRKDCVGSIDSLVELLRGSFDQAVMERMCREGSGLFPAPREITFECSCPDYASMCKHVAAVLYGVGARLDRDADMLFRLRQVTAVELLAGAGDGAGLAKKGPAAGRTLAAADVASVFGIEMDAPAAPPPKKKAAGGGRKTAAAMERPLKKRRAREAGASASPGKDAPVPAKRKATEAPRTSKRRAPKAGPV